MTDGQTGTYFASAITYATAQDNQLQLDFLNMSVVCYKNVGEKEYNGRDLCVSSSDECPRGIEPKVP